MQVKESNTIEPAIPQPERWGKIYNWLVDPRHTYLIFAVAGLVVLNIYPRLEHALLSEFVRDLGLGKV